MLFLPFLFQKCHLSLCLHLSWKINISPCTFVQIKHTDLIRLKDVLGLHGPKDPPCTIIQLDQGNDYRQALKKIYYSTEPHIIISVETYKIAEILNQARDVRMLDEYKSYIIISLDAHTIDLIKGWYVLLWYRANILLS